MQTEQDKKDSRESGADFKFRRRMLTRALTPRATWTGHRKNMDDAIAILDKKKTLTAKDRELVRSALVQHKGIAEAYHEAGIHAAGLFEIIDQAGEHYKENPNSRGYAKRLDWTTGRRGTTVDHAGMVAAYLILVGMGHNKTDAVHNIVNEHNRRNKEYPKKNN